MELKINGKEIDIEEICVMHVDGSVLTIRYSMGQEVLFFQTESEAIVVMDALEQLNNVAINSIGLH